MNRLSALLVLCAAVPAGATFYTVAPDGSGDYPTIQAAIDAAVTGDVIQLSDGVFSGAGNRDLDFHGKSIVVVAAGVYPEECVIDCQGSPTDLHRAFYFHSGEEASSVVRGLTIVNGYADGAWPEGSGGAILCYQSSPTIDRCHFRENHAGWGGAVSAGGTDLTLTQCVFLGNAADHRGGAVDGYSGVNLTLERCTVAFNRCSLGAGVGGNHNCYLLLDRTIVAFNLDGMGVACTNLTDARAICCDIFGNALGDYADCLSNQLGLDDNFSADPLFCAPESQNLRLQPESPCAGENQPICGQIGALPAGCTPHTPETLLVRPDGSGDYPTIQAALDAAFDGDTVALDDGVFTGPGNCDLELQGKALIVRGLNGDAASCVIDCQGSATHPHRGFDLHDGPAFNGRIEDLTIAHGYATGAWPAGSGGAILCNGTAPVIRRCRFVANRADWGGAISAGHVWVAIDECVFVDNMVTYRGGGADAYNHAGLQIDRSTFVANYANAGSAIGGNIWCTLGISRSILAFAPEGAPVEATNSSDVTLSCSDVMGNQEGDYVGPLEGMEGHDENISADPLFCGPHYSDLRLQAGSPCAPEAQPLCGLIGALPVGCQTIPPTVHTVRPDGSGDYPTLQAAVDAARSGDVIELTAGTFSGPGNRDVDLRWKSLTLRSHGGDPDSCRIECGGSPTESHRGFLLGPAGATGSRIEEITVSGGWAEQGGALWVDGGGLTVEGCILSDCRAREGGAVYVAAGAIDLAACRFSENAADSAGGGFLATGEARATIADCVFDGNSAGLQGGGACVREAPDVAVAGCAFERNHSMMGGGAALRNAGRSIVTRCTFRANDVVWAGGGGLYCEGGTPVVDSCLFAQNVAPRGAGISSWGASVAIGHCTFAENGAGQGGGLWSRGGDTALRNSIIAFSTSGHAVHCDYDYSVAVECCDIFGNGGGDWVDCIGWMAGVFGNLSVDPLFCGPGSSNGEYALREESPCAPAQSPVCGLIGAGPVGCVDPAAVEPAPVLSWAHASLAAARPNPFADFTHIAYVVPGSGAAAPVSLAIYDAAGRRVATLVEAREDPGPHRVDWNGADAAGAPVAAGIYFCRLAAGGEVLNRRLVLIR